jgi:hypothetical protein
MEAYRKCGGKSYIFLITAVDGGIHGSELYILDISSPEEEPLDRKPEWALKLLWIW